MTPLAPEAVGTLDVAVLVASSFATSFVSASLGIGGGLILVAIAGLTLPAAAVIPVHGVVQLGSNAGRTLLMRDHVDRAILVPFLLGSAVGAGVGGLIAVELPPAALQLVLACFILWSAWGRTPAFGGGRASAFGGAASALFGMFVGATGPMIAAMLKTLRLGRLEHVATHAACMTGQHLLKVLAFGALGFGFAAYAGLIVLMIAAGFAGTWAGRHVLLRRGDTDFHRVLAVLLTILALRLLWVGLSALLKGGGAPA